MKLYAHGCSRPLVWIAALLKSLLDFEEAAPGCVKKLCPALDMFLQAAIARPRIAAYLTSPMRFPTIAGAGDYKYVDGPVKRSAFAI